MIIIVQHYCVHCLVTTVASDDKHSSSKVIDVSITWAQSDKTDMLMQDIQLGQKFLKHISTANGIRRICHRHACWLQLHL